MASVTIEIQGQSYVCEGLLWYGPPDGMQDVLNIDAAYYQLNGGGGHVPWADLHHAQEVVQRYRGKIIAQDPPQSNPPELGAVN